MDKRLKIIWTVFPSNEREALAGRVKNFFLHWFPPRVLKRSMSWNYSFWLGTISAFLFAITLVTGIILMFLYVPSVERAYWSIEDIENTVSFGWLLRYSHRWAGHLMVIAVFLHMCRVFYTAAFSDADPGKSYRRYNWLIGILLLLITLFLAFTGYLLPWDQLSLWAVTVATHIGRSVPYVGELAYRFLVGGMEIGQNALIRFYTYHCVAVPVVCLLLIAYHMWRIRKDGGLACADNPAFKDEVLSNPNLSARIFLVFIMTCLVVVIISLVARAPLLEPADMSWAPNPAKAPWYFLWLQELIALFTIHIGSYTINGGFVGGVLIPAIFLALLAAWPFLRETRREEIGVWFSRKRFFDNFAFTLISVVIIALILLAYFFRGPYWKLFLPWNRPSTPGGF